MISIKPSKMLGVFKHLLICFILLLFTRCNPSYSLIPIEYFFKSTSENLYQLSPDGLIVSNIEIRNNVSNIFFENQQTKVKIRVTNFKKGIIKSYFWANNHTVFYILNNKYGDGLFYVNIDGSGNLRTIQAKKIDFITDKLWNNKFLLLAISAKTNTQNAYQVNITNWHQKLIGKNPGNIIKWKADNLGKVRLAITSDGLHEKILFRDNYKTNFKTLINSDFYDSVTPLMFTPSNNGVYALSNIKTDKTALVIINCNTGIQTKVIKTNTDIINVSFLNAKPTAVNLAAEKKKIICLDYNFELIYNDIKNKFGLPNLEILQTNKLGEIILVKNYSDTQQDAYYIYNKNKKTLSKVSKSESLPQSEFCEMTPIKYISRDGLNINGYLTLPKNKKNNIGCVILANRSQFENNVWGFLPEVQFLASRGYAVMQINYRGCAGYGKAYKIAGLTNSLKHIQNDIDDGAKWLIEKNIANPQKIAIYGFGFGGFLALNKSFTQPQIYCCAASYSGINNMFTYLKDFNLYSKPYQQMLNKTMGNPIQDADYLRKISPIFNIDKVKIPLYIAQGGKDSLVSINETNQFVKDVRKKNIKVKYLVKDTENHTFINNKNLIELYENLELFLKRNLN